MKTSLIYKGALDNIRKICLLLILLLAGTHLMYAQCPNGPGSGCGLGGISYPRGETVYVDIDFRLRNTSEYTQITAALDEWNHDNESNGSGVFFDYSHVPTTPTPVNTLHITNGPINNIFGRPDPFIMAQTEYGRNDGNQTVYDATITFNTQYARNGERGTPEYFQSYYDQYAPGYDTVFKKKTRHEIGHTLGLCDVPRAEQRFGQSVMNTTELYCANDRCNKQPDSIQACDSAAVSRVLKYNPPPPFPTPRPTPIPYCEQFPLDCYGGGSVGSGYGGRACYRVYEPHYYYVGVQGDPNYEVTVEYEYIYSYCTY